jgi:hypothetical protein
MSQPGLLDQRLFGFEADPFLSRYWPPRESVPLITTAGKQSPIGSFLVWRAELFSTLAYCQHDIVRLPPFRRGQLDPVAEELAGRDIDDSPLIPVPMSMPTALGSHLAVLSGMSGMCP